MRLAPQRRTAGLWMEGRGGHAGCLCRDYSRPVLFDDQLHKDQSSGGNVWITTAGGSVEDCVIKSGSTANCWGAGGGNVYMRGGRLSRCKLIGGTNNTNAQNEWVYSGGSLVAFGSSVIENCTITGCSSGAAPVGLYHGAKMVNCTIAGNGCGAAGALIIGATGGTTDLPSVVNCALYNNKALIADAEESQSVYKESTHRSNTKTTTPEEARSAFDHCAATHKINDTCIAPADFGFADAANGDYSLTSGSPLVNVGADYTAKGGVSAYDFLGATRVVKTVDIGACEYPRVKLTPCIAATIILVR